MYFYTVQNSSNNSFVFFYLLVGYIFASFIWWSYLLYDKNESLSESQTEAAYYKYILKNTNAEITFDQFRETSIYQSISAKYDRQKWMILGEGTVFMILLILGTYQLFRTYNKEVSLARQQNNFLLSITHELKSPIASIKISLQTLLKRLTFEEKYHKLLTNSIEDTERLQSLVENILFAARMENHSYAFEKKKENISEEVNRLVEKFRINISATRNIHTAIQENIEFLVDKEAFRSAIINLLENAYKYSEKGSSIRINLFKNDKQIILEVIDEGKGIPIGEKEKIFQKFYRIGNEETRNTKGTGLGLFIVKKVIESHGGKISVENNKPKGSTFKITFNDSFTDNILINKPSTKPQTV